MHVSVFCEQVFVMYSQIRIVYTVPCRNNEIFLGWRMFMLQNKSLDDLSLGELLQKAHEIQDKMRSTQNKLVNASVVGIAGNEGVQIKITGQYNAVRTTISDDAYSDKEKLEQLVTIAINDAMRKLELIAKE